jgi:iron(III) transport system substrate-binding protein
MPLRAVLPAGSRPLRLAGAVTAVISALLLSACGGGSGSAATDVPAALQETYRTAQSEPSLVYYSVLPVEQNDAVVKGFNQKYPDLKVDVVREASAAIGVRYSSERSAGACVGDVLLLSDPAFFVTGAQNSWWETLDSTKVPEVANWPERFVKDSQYTTITTQPLAIAVNTSKVADADFPKTVADLADPRWKGQLLIADPRSTKAWLAAFNLLRTKYGDEVLRQIAANSSISESSVSGTQQVAAGEAEAVYPTIVPASQKIEASGAPLRTTPMTTDLTLAAQYLTAVSNCSDSPAFAHLFMDYLMSDDGQVALNGKDGLSPRPGVPGVQPLTDSSVLLGDAVLAMTPAEESATLQIFGLS